jgi:hypothetical protein
MTLTEGRLDEGSVTEMRFRYFCSITILSEGITLLPLLNFEYGSEACEQIQTYMALSHHASYHAGITNCAAM